MTPLTRRVLIVSPCRSLSINFNTAFVTCLFRGLNKQSLQVISASWKITDILNHKDPHGQGKIYMFYETIETTSLTTKDYKLSVLYSDNFYMKQK